MALMFDRLAHNYVVDGYYRTDDETVKRCAYLLDTSSSHFSTLDPCCGEGMVKELIVWKKYFSGELSQRFKPME